MKMKKTGSSIRTSIGIGLSPQTRSFRSSGYIRSRSASELLLRKRPSFLASRRFAQGKPDTDVPNNVSGINYSLNKNLSVLFPVWVFGHWVLGINW
jgi:hypothetical protein